VHSTQGPAARARRVRADGKKKERRRWEKAKEKEGINVPCCESEHTRDAQGPYLKASTKGEGSGERKENERRLSWVSRLTHSPGTVSAGRRPDGSTAEVGKGKKRNSKE